MKKLLLTVSAAALLFASCASFPMAVGGELGSSSGKKIEASTEGRYNFLGLFPLNVDEVGSVLPMLQNQCPDGKVAAISAIYVQNWALFGTSDKIQTTAYCQ
jgi:hypothetical protein